MVLPLSKMVVLVLPGMDAFMGISVPSLMVSPVTFFMVALMPILAVALVCILMMSPVTILMVGPMPTLVVASVNSLVMPMPMAVVLFMVTTMVLPNMSPGMGFTAAQLGRQLPHRLPLVQDRLLLVHHGLPQVQDGFLGFLKSPYPVPISRAVSPCAVSLLAG